MIEKPFAHSDLINRLPAVRGTLEAGALLAPFTWFRVGGPAEVLFRPADVDDLAAFLKECPKDLPVMALGVGSNLLVRDGGVPGVVVRLGRGFNEISIDEAAGTVRAGAGVPDAKVAEAAAEAGLAGLAFLRGIPGAIGGALAMNAGAYGGETYDHLVSVEGVTRQGRKIILSPDDISHAYRTANPPEEMIFTAATFKGEKGDPAVIRAEMAEIMDKRAESQPIKERTGGSTFKNPEGGKAWELIDSVGGRGLRINGAMVSDLHCNFLINTGTATGADLEAVGEEVRTRVKEQMGVTLEWEIRRIGLPASADMREGAR
ncbi:MAG: UDP-N-acetylmuramate dehydrogenase [Alphaproteobacteria bacterium]